MASAAIKEGFSLEEEENKVAGASFQKYRIPCKGSAELAATNKFDSSCVTMDNSDNNNISRSKTVCLYPTMALGNSNPPDIDEDLRSRQLAVYGRVTMRPLFASNVLVSGMRGLGAKIAKNLVLAGVKSLTLHDEGAMELWDFLAVSFFQRVMLERTGASRWNNSQPQIVVISSCIIPVANFEY
ncbi:hypothetical protein SAY86_010288 [Trapa natans]|uniref:THIF-type NAD/FAD binding fold domain-containing protein n=1 Tax=Trapa natans TaxID=22666 RepID=A0AAN7QTY0_TRANT|nr:hypothetical protein SAY86_010288 [Trapa natans]